MLTPPKKLFYAVEAVLYIAYNGSVHPISSRVIAKQQRLPPRYLEQMMQKLVHAGVLRGLRGPRGGYMLARERRRITAGEICQILMDDDDCASSYYPSTQLGKKLVCPLWTEIGNETMEKLSNVTIADLCSQAQEKAIEKEEGKKTDYAI
jgi:Rrf2 family protein